MIDNEKIGKFIIKLRKEKKMTQNELANLIFVDRTTISKWEHGENTIKVDVLHKLAAIFNVTINELMIGERQNKNNIEQINNATLNIIKTNEKMRKKFKLAISLIIILIILLIGSFFTYYFFNNYNSIVVYKIYGEDEHFSTSNGLMIVTKDKFYIQLGNIQSLNDENIKKIRLYYIKEGNEFLFYERNGIKGNSKFLYESSYDEEVFQYSDLKYVVDNMNLRITYDDNEVAEIKLSLDKSYSNDKIFTRHVTPVNIEDIREVDKEIPEYIKDNYIFDEEKERYYLEVKDDEKKVVYEYLYTTNTYSIYEYYDDYYVNFYYTSLGDGDLSYYKEDNADVYGDKFFYDFSENGCIYGECDNNIIDYFIETYLNEIKNY